MKKKGPGNFQTLLFFIGFILLFFLVFALGVIVGKGLTDYEAMLTKNNNGQQLISTVTSIFKKKESKEEKNEEAITVITESPDTEVEEISEVNKEQTPETDQTVAVTEKVPVAKTEDGQKKVAETKEPEKKETAAADKKADSKPEKEAAGSEQSKPEDKQAAKKEEEEVVAKLDYSIPEFPKTDSGGKYTVQVGAFKNKDTAYNLEKVLNEKGYPSFVIKAVLPERGTWYRVRVGTFNDKQKASDYAEKLKIKENLEITQITLNN